MIKREIYMNRILPFMGKDVIKVITGIRRAGKSVMLALIQQELSESGIKSDNMITFNFEDLRNVRLLKGAALHEEILERTRSLQGKVYLFFDEIQEVKNWEKCINSIRKASIGRTGYISWGTVCGICYISFFLYGIL